MSKTSKGNYYVKKTIEWYRDYELWRVEKVERYTSFFNPKTKRIEWRTSDLWGCDLVAQGNGEEHWVQVRSNEGDISSAVKKLKENIMWWPNTPLIKVFVAYWPKRAPTSHGPDMVEVERDLLPPNIILSELK